MPWNHITNNWTGLAAKPGHISVVWLCHQLCLTKLFLRSSAENPSTEWKKQFCNTRTPKGANSSQLFLSGRLFSLLPHSSWVYVWYHTNHNTNKQCCHHSANQQLRISSLLSIWGGSHENGTVLQLLSYNNVCSCLSQCPPGPECLQKANLIFIKHTDDEKYKMAARVRRGEVTDLLVCSASRLEHARATCVRYLHFSRTSVENHVKKVPTMHSQGFRSCHHKPKIFHFKGSFLLTIQRGREGASEREREWGRERREREREGGSLCSPHWERWLRIQFWIPPVLSYCWVLRRLKLTWQLR